MTSALSLQPTLNTSISIHNTVIRQAISVWASFFLVHCQDSLNPRKNTLLAKYIMQFAEYISHNAQTTAHAERQRGIVHLPGPLTRKWHEHSRHLPSDSYSQTTHPSEHVRVFLGHRNDEMIQMVSANAVFKGRARKGTSTHSTATVKTTTRA
jgi:hypothetical protein